MIRAAFVCSAVWLLSGCGGAGGEAGEGTEVPGEGLRTCVVDPVAGVDASPPSGQFCTTSRTLTFQLAELARIGASSVDVIVRAGVYSPTTEQFPIVIPRGIRVRGDDAADAGRIVFAGSGPYTSEGGGLYQTSVVLRGAARLSNVHIQSDGIALLLDNTQLGAGIRNVDIERCERGIVTLQHAEATIQALRIRGCILAGIETRDQSSPVFARSSVTESSVGVLVEDDSHPRFGGTGAGANTFALNTLCDFRSRTTASLNVVDNTWDDDVFSFFPQLSCAAGENLVVEGAGDILYQYLPRQNAPLFPATAPVALLLPEYGAFLNTTQPGFAWSAASRTNKMALAVWDRQPDVGMHGVQNADHIVLFWHSGLGTGSVGSVAFADLKRPVAGDIRNLGPPEALVPGRPYYWAVWEWDADGLQIEYSSELRVFTIRI